jgi:lipid-A-disaccharide synthase
MSRLFITVAEHSADMHAAQLVRSLKRLRPDLQIDALGGPELASAGAAVLHDTVSRAAMGLKAFKRTLEIKRRLRFTREFYARQKPDLHICCDSWTMNVHFARLAKSFGTPVLYYIAPQTWASRELRVHELARLADRVACILPFEEAYFRNHGVRADYVGHPLFDSIRARGDVASASVKKSMTIALPCGSRAGVARANLPRMLDVARRLLIEEPTLRFLIPTTSITDPIARSHVKNFPEVSLHLDGFDEILPRCDLALCVSGTATLHAAALGVPMIIVYAGSRLFWHGLARHIVRARTFGLINLLASDGRLDGKNLLCPEFIPWFGSTEPVVRALLEMIRNPELRAMQRERLQAVIHRIGKPGASDRVAEMAIEMLSGN